jgi:hypothetical protein
VWSHQHRLSCHQSPLPTQEVEENFIWASNR